jgi:hypothetical protein
MCSPDITVTKPTSKPRSSKPGSLDEPYVHGDPIPAPEAVERNSATDWAAFSELSARHDAGFAPTAPASLHMRLSDEDRPYAATVPAGLQALPEGMAPDQVPAQGELTLEDVLAEARRNNRVCPSQDQWNLLYELLPGKTRRFGRIQPTPPLTGRAWTATPDLAKRMALREHIEWAAAHNCLEDIMDFLTQLPEDQWHKMGE